MKTRSRDIFISVLGAMVLVAVSVADLFTGELALSLKDIFTSPEGSMEHTVLFSLRIPRIITAIIAGAALALGGLQMQSIFRNPLADPHIMGISGGASVGAAIGTMICSGFAMSGAAGSVFAGTMNTSPFAGAMNVAVFAFAGAAAAAAVVVAVSRKIGSSNGILIFGVMLGFAANAIVSVIQFSSSEEGLKMFYNWSAGSFSSTGWTQIAIMGLALLIGLSLCIANAKGLDIILFGESFAELSGADVKKIRMTALASCCIMAAAVTAFCGPLGFVGIVSAHLARRITGSSSHRRIILPVILLGAIMSVFTDWIIQIYGSPLPAGSLMALIGCPVVLAIMLSGSRKS